jgi:hypothetical protein
VGSYLSTHPLVMIGVIENISYSTAKMCRAPSCLHSILSAITKKLNISGHMFIRSFFLLLVCGTGAQSLFAPFSYTLYIGITAKRPSVCPPCIS